MRSFQKLNLSGLKVSKARAFTLIELLIAVAIITILALIALSNILEAQTRAKVSRVKADLRSVATGLEAYRIDQNGYPPNDGVYQVLPIQITTPVAYMTNVHFADPFCDKERVILANTDPLLARFYTYTHPVTWGEVEALAASNAPLPPVEAVDAPDYNEGAHHKYGPWRLVSNGPDRKYPVPGEPTVVKGSDILYDATNGTASWGNILRTQRRNAEPVS